MKVWYQHGSEHSANLVMIGHFVDATAALRAKEIIAALTTQVLEDEEKGTLVIGSPSDRFGEEMLHLLGSLNVNVLGPSELEQLAYDVNVEVEGDKIVVTTEELDIAAFLKILVQQGARIEVYSAHDYPGTGRGRGK